LPSTSIQRKLNSWWSSTNPVSKEDQSPEDKFIQHKSSNFWMETI
jgi:hypothetical protein